MNYQAQGLYKVVEGVYQLRGHEISKVTFFRVYPGTHTLPFTLIVPEIRLAQPQANGINSITYRIAVGSQADARRFTQTYSCLCRKPLLIFETWGSVVGHSQPPMIIT
jgi:hypothetical protein